MSDEKEERERTEVKEKEEVRGDNSLVARETVLKVAFGGAALLCGGVGFVRGLKHTQKLKGGKPLPNQLRLYRLGVSAFLWATAFSVSSFYLGARVVMWKLDVHTIPEFGEKMREILPPKAQKLKTWTNNHIPKSFQLKKRFEEKDEREE